MVGVIVPTDGQKRFPLRVCNLVSILWEGRQSSSHVNRKHVWWPMNKQLKEKVEKERGGGGEKSRKAPSDQILRTHACVLPKVACCWKTRGENPSRRPKKRKSGRCVHEGLAPSDQKKKKRLQETLFSNGSSFWKADHSYLVHLENEERGNLTSMGFIRPEQTPKVSSLQMKKSKQRQ